MHKNKILKNILVFNLLVISPLVVTSCNFLSNNEVTEDFTISVEINKPELASASLSKTSGKVGETVTLSIDLTSEAFIKSISINGNFVDISKREFKPIKGTNLICIEVDLNKENDPFDPTKYRKETYSHNFSSSDLNKEGGECSEINGLIFSNSAPKYMKNDTNKGVQIGSSTKYHTKEEPFTLSATIPNSIIVSDILINASNAVNGSGSARVYFENDSYDISTVFSNSDPDWVRFNEINISSTILHIDLYSNLSKAIYFKNITIEFIVPLESDFHVKEDENIDIELGPVTPGKNGIPTLNFEPIKKETYYKDIDFTSTKEILFDSLRTLVNNFTFVSYGDARYMLQYCDEDINNDGYIYGLYNGVSYISTWDNGVTWNREHVWCKNHMKLDGKQLSPSNSYKGIASDLHNLRAANMNVNSARGDKFFDNTSNGTYFFPNQGENESDHRGDVARIIFYMYLTYDGLYLGEDPTINPDVSFGKLSTLISWAKEDPVDSFELRRNDRIYTYQGNRNPFIDYEDLIDKIFK